MGSCEISKTLLLFNNFLFSFLGCKVKKNERVPRQRANKDASFIKLEEIFAKAV